MGDVIEKLTGGASIAPDDYVDVGYRTIPKGAVNSSGVADMSGCKNVSEIFFKKNISSKTSSGELVTSLRDLVPTAPNMGRIVRICGKTEDFLMPQGVYSIIVKEKNSEDFLIAYSNSPEYRKIIMAEKNGSTQVHIRNGEFLNIDIPLPPYEEQMKIGEYFKTLDNLITLHQRKYDKLQNIKKSMLEKMFPKNGSNVPEIRFSGFTDPWEQRKLIELTSVFTDGDWIEAKDQSDSGIRLVQTGNVGTTEYLDKINNAKWISEDTFQTLKCKEIYEGDILISRLPEPAGRACIMPNLGTKMITAVDCTIVRTNENNDSKFLVQYLSTPSYFKIVNTFLGGGTRQRISRNNLAEIIVPTPCNIAEQAKIGAYFSQLDHLITLHQRELKKLQNIKKSMLEKMFV